MLKIAQAIDREARMNQMWQMEDEHEEDEEDQMFGTDDKPERKEKPKKEQSNASKRPNKQKFAEIMKNQDAFPTLENDF